jgi:hypothetical protein
MRGTGWQAHFNMAQHRQAEMAFRRCRQLEPHRVRGMEIYSTVLWFLKREHELCYLAQVLPMDQPDHVSCVRARVANEQHS